MKNPCRALLLAITLILPLSAQEGDGFGFLNVVNLIPGDIPADVTIAGKTLFPGGLKAGSDTGWFMVPVGKTSMTIELAEPKEKSPRVAKNSGKIELVEGISNVIAIYLQPDNRQKPDGTPFPAKIRIKSFPAFDSKGFALRFVSTCPGANRFQLGPNKIDPKPFVFLDVPKWSGRDFEVMHNGKSIGIAKGSSEQGSFYIFVGSDGKDSYVTAMTRSGTQQAPAWRKKKKPYTPEP